MEINAFSQKIFNSVLNSGAFSRRPVSTYRLQLNSKFTFRKAAIVVPYLHELGITDCYLSPYFNARPGSMHGYDISNYNELNPEIGSWARYKHFVGSLQKKGMGQILDFVPNHMGTAGNPWWLDVLENGQSSPFAIFFDIDWEPVKAELRGKVLLPVLEDQYGKVLQGGEIHLIFERGVFSLQYHDNFLPVDVKTYVIILEGCLTRLKEGMTEEDPDLLEIHSIYTACNNLPGRDEREPNLVHERQREKEIIKKRLWDVCSRNQVVSASVSAEVDLFNGVAGDSTSFDRLHRLLEAQVYRMSYWRVAAEEINYRRFFDINELVALTMEDPSVFKESHKMLTRLLSENMVTGLRIDHVDGLFDPAGYLSNVQRNFFLDLCLKRASENPEAAKYDTAALVEKFSEIWDRGTNTEDGSEAAVPLYIIVEKILGEKESLRGTWPVAGTTGYEFLNALNGIFIEQKNARDILNIYKRFSGITERFENIVYHCKNLVMMTSMSAEVNLLAHQLDRISESTRQYRDFTLNSHRDVIREVISCFPVYRTYINSSCDEVEEQDKAYIEAAVTEAKRRNPAISSSVFDFLQNTLLMQYPEDMSDNGKKEQRVFVMRFQQFTGPVMAKGVEDTAFYIYNPLVSLNEVGGNPRRFGTSVDEFHRQNKQRQTNFPHSMVSTSTHDSKRSEDVRARINVLSEIPREWRAALARWSRMNRGKKTVTAGITIPDKNEEYLIYQTLLGTFPVRPLDEKLRTDYCKRIQDYMLKAIREAKVNSSWMSPDNHYEAAVMNFVSGILKPLPSNAFFNDFGAFNRQIARWGMYNSLSQTLLKVVSPGVPDLYQGNEIWNYCLVDPDNRGQVNFTGRKRLLSSLKKKIAGSHREELARSLVKKMEDGMIKLYVASEALKYRRENAGLFNEGSYMPLKGIGSVGEQICAFMWQKENKRFLVCVPRLVAGLTRLGSLPPLGSQIWGDSMLILPDDCRGQQFHNIFTGENIKAGDNEATTGLPLSLVFSVFPVAALEFLQH